MRRLGISSISRVFAAFALLICFYSFFISPETEVKTQAIYWFCVALVSSVIPYFEEVVTYVKSIKLGDIEIALKEVKREIQRVDDKVEKLDNKLLASLGQVRQNEASLSQEARENRQKIYDESAQVLALLPPESKISLQKRLTLNHLNEIGIDVQTLKEILGKIGYYQGSIDTLFTPELVQAIEKFQSEHTPGVPDGIVGPITLSKIAELHS
ncbi:peptidoglycan-binding protein [Leptolyngbya sp. CCNP1308]|uniref:peptidoglycan-binding domain-containing protein n=1 Tax=Leptolyngbya sp. CCNP1308 TaxID=3110255 RepID=UPI002B20B7D4|nr:peptidoglycan-binding protein [Leptolyngbya sp. CCNP1308]MEA5449310.1 peptidoglycan-binding protein [Leptolyngbya sp. CCNP1308]